MRALITGISGFVGSHLAEFLLRQNFKVYGTIRRRSILDNIEHLKNELKLIEADLTDAYATLKMLTEAEPDYIFHLAAQSFVPTSWRSPVATTTANVVGTINLFEGILHSKLDPKIHVAGSSEEYGMVYKDELPIRESNPLRPLSPYGVTKVAQEMLSYQYHKSYGMKIVVTRAFNHTGPRRGEFFAESNFAKQIAEIQKGRRKPLIYVGNLNAKRDYSDVRDVVRAYFLALHKCDFGEPYNICSGKNRTIKSVLNELLKISKVSAKVIKDPSRLRPSDVEILLGDCTKFKKKTGWEPKIPFSHTLRDLLNYWRGLV